MATKQAEDLTGRERADFLIAEPQRPGITPAEVTAIYDKWSSTYDQDIVLGGYQNRMELFMPQIEAALPDKTVKILDICAGTGVLGQELKERGFNNVDALDASYAMLDVARQKNVYRKYICAFFGPPNADLRSDSYDVVTAIGAFTEGHLKEDCLDEIIRIVKPGGYFITAIPLVIMVGGECLSGIEPRMKLLEEEGKWKRIKQTELPNYRYDKTAYFYVFKIL